MNFYLRVLDLCLSFETTPGTYCCLGHLDCPSPPKQTYISSLHLECGFVAGCFNLPHSLVLAASLWSANLFPPPVFIPLPQHPALQSLILRPRSSLPAPAHCFLESSSISIPSLRTGPGIICKPVRDVPLLSPRTKAAETHARHCHIQRLFNVSLP